MPAMIRPNNKASKVAREILGAPQNQHESKVNHVKRNGSKVYDRNVIELNQLNKGMGQNSVPSVD